MWSHPSDHDLGRGLLVGEVPAEHEGTTDQDLAGLPPGYFVSLLVGDPHLDTGQRPPHRGGHDLGGVVGRGERPQCVVLGQPVGGEDGLDAQFLAHPADENGGDGGRPDDGVAETGEVELVAPGQVQ